MVPEAAKASGDDGNSACSGGGMAVVVRAVWVIPYSRSGGLWWCGCGGCSQLVMVLVAVIAIAVVVLCITPAVLLW